MEECWADIQKYYPKILHQADINVAATILYIAVKNNGVRECKEFVSIRPDAVSFEESSAFRLACELGMSFAVRSD